MEMLTITCIYLGIRKYSFLENKIWLSMLTFFPLFYNYTYNVMRQWLSVALLFYALSCLINEKKKGKIIKFISLFVLAYSIHKSTILVIIPLLIYEILNYDFKHIKILKYNRLKININKVFHLIMIAIGMIMLFNMKALSDYLNEHELFDNYIRYIENGLVNYKVIPLKILPIAIIFLLGIKQFLNNTENAWFFIICFVFNYCIIEILSSGNYFTARLGYIFQVFNIVSFPQVCDSYKTPNIRLIMRLLIIGYFAVYWTYVFVILGYNQTVPYILGI